MTFRSVTQVLVMALTSMLLVSGGSGCQEGGSAESVPEVKDSGSPKSRASSGTAPRQTPPVSLTDADVKDALLKGAQLWENGEDASTDVQDILVSVASRLPAVPVMIDGVPGKWTKVRLNALGAKLDAIRFSSPLETPGDLVWAVAYTESSKFSWDVTPANGMMQGVKVQVVRRHVLLEGVDVEEENKLVLQTLEQGQIAPGKSYFLRFLFSTEDPRDLFVRIKVIPADQKQLKSANDIAGELGIPIPIQFNSAATPEDRVEDLSEDERRNSKESTTDSPKSKDP